MLFYLKRPFTALIPNIYLSLHNIFIRPQVEYAKTVLSNVHYVKALGVTLNYQPSIEESISY